MNAVSHKAEVMKEMQEMFGQVPEWMKLMPEEAAVGFWAMQRDLQLAETKIPNKYKELIGLAVAGATRCRYCQLFHTEAAKLFGATDEEIAEASAMSGFTMMASTYVNSMGIDYSQFERETRAMVAYVRNQQMKGGPKKGPSQPRA
jgi:AhpD family alkylhydroperoxidase